MSGNRKKKQDEYSGNLALYAGYSDYIWNCGISDDICSCNEFYRLQRQKPVMNFVGIANYIKILQDASFWQAVDFVAYLLPLAHLYRRLY